jgi:hypothetical protein
VPQGHWQTTTFTAAVGGLTAPLVIMGPNFFSRIQEEETFSCGEIYALCERFGCSSRGERPGRRVTAQGVLNAKHGSLLLV